MRADDFSLCVRACVCVCEREREEKREMEGEKECVCSTKRDIFYPVENMLSKNEK